MGQNWKPGKPTVELSSTGEARPSRIRRDPPAAEEKPKALRAYPTEYETWVVVIGVALFGIALMIVWFGISDFTSG